MFTHRHVAAIACSAALFAAGCASLRPIAPEVASAPDRPDVELAVVEGRPNALILNAKLPTAREGDRLRLLRHDETGKTFALVEVPLEEQFLALAHGAGIGLSDDTVEKGRTYDFEVVLVREESAVQSASATVRWGAPIDRPESVVVHQLVDGVIEIEWAPGSSAAVFVRDVLSESAPLRRIDVPQAAGGKWILGDLSTDGVYAVRVALSRDDGGYSRFGVPSEEVYVTLVPTEEGDDAGSR